MTLPTEQDPGTRIAPPLPRKLTTGKALQVVKNVTKFRNPDIKIHNIQHPNCDSQLNWVFSVKGLAQSVQHENPNLRVVGKVSTFNRELFVIGCLKLKLLVLG
jgi:siroheme synthase